MDASLKGTRMAVVWLILLVIITGCNTKMPVSPNEDHSISNQPQHTDSIKDAVNEESAAEAANIPTNPPVENPPVEYDPAWPDSTVKSSHGHLVNSCVPDELHDKATTLTTSDGVYLSALVLGSGDQGVLLAHEQGYSICSFLDMGIELADSGYLVVIPEYRNHGASQDFPEDNQNIDRDADAALSELKRLGAQRLFLAGASCGGSTAIIAGVRQDLPIEGLIILSSPAQCGPLDAIPSVEKIEAPSLFVFSPGDYGGSIEKEVRKLYQASGAADKELIVDESGYHGTDMYHRGEQGDALRSRLIDFVKMVFN
ncbi:alpha/beta hydrolase [Paenibacillus senegalensis]|uniref:alpha/beta hydrolase n=1 Tax=Paenibacillus senegalensis TaxID=1465766 RepID=UPI0002881391|nr:alpha/beta hydrolase [Paenibacillus senegalensis]